MPRIINVNLLRCRAGIATLDYIVLLLSTANIKFKATKLKTKLLSWRGVRAVKKTFLQLWANRSSCQYNSYSCLLLCFYVHSVMEAPNFPRHCFFETLSLEGRQASRCQRDFCFVLPQKKTFTTTCFCRRLFYLCRFDYITVLLLSRSPLYWTRETSESKVRELSLLFALVWC